ncbi:MAG: glycosyltransferase [Bacteroidales bacterium]|nr:glycosyltransferase [Bacteroidales bacterium]
MNNSPMVSVIVITYNQEQWIQQTIESIINQKTDYSFEIIIGEDFGTDGTRAICKKYADNYDNVTLLPQDKNLGLIGNYVQCVKACTGKYIMCCAGDDYWHNPNKIQLQVDFMEQHPECVLCHTDIDILYVKSGKLFKDYKQSYKIIPPEGMIQCDVLAGKDIISAVTMCMKREIVVQYVPLDKYVELQFPYEDWPTILILAAYGEIRYIPISTATYRKGQISITNTIDYQRIKDRWKKLKQMTEFLYSLFPSFGPFNDGEYYDTYVYHALLNAAYENNDYLSAREFAKKDPHRGMSSKMAKCYLSFKLFRYYRNHIRKRI